MTMFTLPNFCRVCLKPDKNLIDLELLENEPNEPLMSKLQQCVSEVEWSLLKAILCHSCIKRLNIAYLFKKQCVQSATMLKNCMSPENNILVPNQKFVKIVLTPQTQTFQNVFVNVVPATISEPINNNVVNLNSPKEEPLDQLLTDSKSEELSVEIDPTDIGLPDDEEHENGLLNDWEDVISATKIAASKYVPILPKQTESFSSSGEHFLSSQNYAKEYNCERCSKNFGGRIELRNHIKTFHMGKLPFTCDLCSNQFILRSEYEACLNQHKEEGESSLTLNDFKDDDGDGEGESICDICHRQFNSASGLLRHKVRKHNQRTKKKYFIKGMKNARCDICNREFSTQSYMQLHRKLHLRDDMGYKYKVLGTHRYVKNETQSEKDDNQHDDSNNFEDESSESDN